MTERADAFSGPGCVCTFNCLDKNQLPELTSSLISVDPYAIKLANLASNDAIFVRGGVLKSTLVVDNDTTVHDVHTHTQFLSAPQS